MNKQIKAIVCDLDGTLLTRNKKILHETKRALIKAQEDGTKLILASSRSYFMLEEIIKELRMDEFEGYAICKNGLEAINTKTLKSVKAEGLSYETAQKIYNYAKVNKKLISFESKGGFQFYLPNRLKFALPMYYFVRFRKKRSEKRQINFELFGDFRFSPVERFEVIKRFDQVLTPIQKCGLIQIGTVNHMDNVLKNLRECFEGEAEFIRISKVWIDIMPVGISKASGVEMLKDQLGFGLESVIAFGDAENDIDIISKAKIGIAMGNAMETLKIKAMDITLDNESNGIVHALKKYSVI